ncbi:unnamed protein product [Psylliodes chrysocephalus]|uniref:Major facilitator superfamily (MFS) profile domain-containing protein n=1 Tax=Psylliodes chrysocephalus TaxID=3402493 RepID=A0A9P0D8D2_9CUCU|nr:unnamed protein product [Psylliodes chrysocephala]
MIEMKKQNSSPELQEVKYFPTKGGEFQPQIADKKPDTLFLYFTIISANLVVMGGSSSLAWTSPVIPKLQSNDTNINPLAEPATTLQISMMMGLPALVSLSGTLLVPLMSDIFGRKNMLQLFAMFMVLCDIVIAFSNRIIYIIIGRCILMSLYNGSCAILIIFIMEMCENHNRGKFGCFIFLFPPIGSLYSYFFGSVFSVRTFTLVTGIPLIILVVFLFFTVETPVYLLSKGRFEDCLQALRKLRSNKNRKEIQLDFDEIEFSLKQRHSVKNATVWSLFKTRQSRVGLGLALIPSIVHVGIGTPIMLAFLGPIFNIADIGLSGDLVAIIIGIINICSVFCTTMVVEKFGRRTLLFFSTLGCSLSQLFIGLFFYFKYINSPIIPSIKLLPVISVIAYFVFYSTGLGPLPHTITSELFTSEFRSIAVSILITVMGVVFFFVTSGFPLLIEYVGIHWNFWFFSSFGFVGTVILYVLLPETRGKSIMEIQEKLKSYKIFKPRNTNQRHYK